MWPLLRTGNRQSWTVVKVTINTEPSNVRSRKQACLSVSKDGMRATNLRKLQCLSTVMVSAAALEQEGPGFISQLGKGNSVWNLHVLPTSLCGFSLGALVSPTIKNMYSAINIQSVSTTLIWALHNSF